MRLLAAAIVLTLACHDNGGTGASTDDGGAPASLADLQGGSCDVQVAAPADEGAAHIDTCSPATYHSKPPSSGNHYPVWPLFRVYDQPVPWGFLVHGLEHGAVVIVYNCPAGCADQVAALKGMIESMPTKPGCSRPPIIVAPDPTLDVPFAASAWGFTLRAQCFDRDRFAAFVERRVNHGRENIPNDCGSLDREAAGWCAPAVPLDAGAGSDAGS
jgi:hypothetical protein